MYSPLRRFLVIFTLPVLFLSGSAICGAQNFPSREIRLVVPYGPGGGVDVVARLVAEKAEKTLGVPLVIINNAAGGGAVGTLNVAQSKPDGYMLLAGTTGPLILKPMLTPDIRYRYTDFTPISRTVVMPVALWVRPDAPWKNLKEFVEYGKKNPGKLRASVGQAGGFMEVLSKLFQIEAGIDITEIPTSGGTLTSAALMGGHSELCMDAISTNVSFLRAGRMRALACTHTVPEFPNVRTFEQEGYPGVNLKLWHGIFGPKGLPKPVLSTLTKAFEKACGDAALKEQLGKLRILADYRDPDETLKIISTENEVIVRVLKQQGIVK